MEVSEQFMVICVLQFLSMTVLLYIAYVLVKTNGKEVEGDKVKKSAIKKSVTIKNEDLKSIGKINNSLEDLDSIFQQK